MKLILCICTYRRAQLLQQLLEDVLSQTICPEQMVIVDGDPASGEVLEVMDAFAHDMAGITYLPSNHANLPYQRYLGWRVAQKSGCEILLYLDDDLRLMQKNALELIVEPLTRNLMIIGTTAVQVGAVDANRQKQTNAFSSVIKSFGSGKKIRPGGLTPSGYRKPPASSSSGYANVEWMSGRVMCFLLSALKEKCFLEDLFAMYETQLGKAEDTLLSRCVLHEQKGQYLCLLNLNIQHPNDVPPNAYPTKPYQYGYAVAFSRRLLNDHYRGINQTLLSDRVALLVSYLGNTLINWFRVFMTFEKNIFAYAWGFTLGSLRGLFQKPAAQKLTPHIDWRKDAGDALSQKVGLQ
jgi:glycosyltransferase involved in cell wall biosynthesis